MKKELVSIIVPIYNNDKTLRRCVDSLLEQKYSNIEILLIDDGSTDNSAQICEEYALKDDRIRVFHKINGGESSARNVGLDKATGSWITFCDADDFVGKTYIFSFMYRQTLQKDSLYITGEREGFTEKDLKKVKGIYYSGIVNQEMLDKIQKNAVNWGKLYNKKIINSINLRFNEQVFYGGDKLFTMQYLKEIKEVVYNRKYFPYNYINNFNPNKFMHGFEKQLINYHIIINELQKTWEDKCNTTWFLPHFKLLFYSIFAQKISKHQQLKNLQTIRDEKETKNILEELIKQESKTKFIWRLFLRRKYSILIKICNPAVKISLKIFASDGNIWLKKILKNIG